MARISELHYSNALAASSGIPEFVEVALSPGENPADFTVALYEADGTQGLIVPLSDPGVVVFDPPDSDETIFSVDGPVFDFVITDPDGATPNNFEAIALVNTTTGEVVNFFDIGGGTTAIEAVDGLAAGETTVNLPVETAPNDALGSLQFNLPRPDELVTETITVGTAGVPCFTSGTLIETSRGAVPVEDLVVGDLVPTRDNGLQSIRWIGRRQVAAEGAFAPIVITRGRFGATADLVLSPQHRVLVSGLGPHLLIGHPEVLVPAKHLADGDTIFRREGGEVEYIHLLFDRHEILTANGVLSESFHPSSANLPGFDQGAYDEVIALFPELGPDLLDLPACRPVIQQFEAQALARFGAMRR